MTKQQCRTVYQFDELSDSAKEKARDWYRLGAMDYEWWDYVYEDAITHNWPDHTIAPGPATCCYECLSSRGIDESEVSDDTELLDEGSFSWRECESCGSQLGGDRHDAHALHRQAFGPNAERPGDFHHISICTDCLLFHANGDEPEDWNR